MEEKLQIFFKAYEKCFNDALNGNIDIERTAAAFAPYFVEASPKGIIGGKNDDAFRKAIPEGYTFYKQIGTTSMRILSQTLTLLDDFHRMVKIRWQAVYQQKDNPSQTIEFDVIYLVHMGSGEPVIFAYITGDEQKVLREKGLVPPES